jgi:hypothetical protein
MAFAWGRVQVEGAERPRASSPASVSPADPRSCGQDDARRVQVQSMGRRTWCWYARHRRQSPPVRCFVFGEHLMLTGVLCCFLVCVFVCFKTRYASGVAAPSLNEPARYGAVVHAVDVFEGPLHWDTEVALAGAERGLRQPSVCRSRPTAAGCVLRNTHGASRPHKSNLSCACRSTCRPSVFALSCRLNGQRCWWTAASRR